MDAFFKFMETLLSSGVTMALVGVGLLLISVRFIAPFIKKSFDPEANKPSTKIGIALLILGLLSAVFTFIWENQVFSEWFDANVFILTLFVLAVITIVASITETVISHKYTRNFSKENDTLSKRVVDLSTRNTELSEQVSLLSAHRAALKEQMQQLRSISNALADQTRKPLFGIEEIWCQISKLLEKVPPRGKFWFVGMTLGFGPVHKYRIEEEDGRIKDAYELLREKWPHLAAGSYEKTIEFFNAQLTRIIPSSGENSTVVCLNKNSAFLKRNFIEPFMSRKSHNLKPENVDDVLRQTLRWHNAVETLMRTKDAHYLDFIPLQMVVAEIKGEEPGSPVRKACVVFYVGTGYIGSQHLDEGEVGFYSELENMCDMFVNVAESLYDSGKSI